MEAILEYRKASVNFKPPFLSLKSFLDQDEYEKIGLECQEYLCAASWNLEEIVQGNGQPNPKNLKGWVWTPTVGVNGLRVDQKKSFSKSTHTQDPESVYAGPKERDEACQWIHHQGMIFSTTWKALQLYFRIKCNQLDCNIKKYHCQALSLQVAPDTMATAYALFDRALFSMKVKRSHVGVLGMILRQVCGKNTCLAGWVIQPT